MTASFAIPDVIVHRPRTIGAESVDNLMVCVLVTTPSFSRIDLWIVPVARWDLHAQVIERLSQDHPTATEIRPLFEGRVHATKFEISRAWVDTGSILSVIQLGFSGQIDNARYRDILNARIRIPGYCAIRTVKSVAQSSELPKRMLVVQDNALTHSSSPQAT